MSVITIVSSMSVITIDIGYIESDMLAIVVIYYLVALSHLFRFQTHMSCLPDLRDVVLQVSFVTSSSFRLRVGVIWHRARRRSCLW